MKMRALALASIALCVAAGGCSFVFVDGPPSAHQSMTTFRCDESKVWPVIDGIVSLSSVVGAVTAEEEVRTVTEGFIFGTTRQDTISKAEKVAGMLSGTVIYGISAWIGNRRVNECRAAMAELARRSEVARAVAMSLRPAPRIPERPRR